jgi:predicted MFS family arabinose efflux permease
LVSADELMNAVSLYTMGFNFARVVGPSLGGVLILWIGVTGCFLIYGVALILSALGLLMIRLPPTDSTRKGEQNLLREAQEGFQYVWHAPAILSSIGAAYILSIFVGTYQRFLPVFAKEVLSVGPRGLGFLMGAPGLGAVVSLLFLAAAGERWKKETLLWITATLTSLFLILFCLSQSFLLSLGLLALVGGGQIAFRTISRVTIQMEVPRDLLGRVISVFNLDQGMRSIGSMVIGLFATLFGAALGLALTSVISLALTSTLFYYFLGPHRN